MSINLQMFFNGCFIFISFIVLNKMAVKEAKICLVGVRELNLDQTVR